MLDIQEYMNRVVRDAMQSRSDQLEMWTEKALVDPQGRGILVHDLLEDVSPYYTHIQLSEHVPYGRIDVHQVTSGATCIYCCLRGVWVAFS